MRRLLRSAVPLLLIAGGTLGVSARPASAAYVQQGLAFAAGEHMTVVSQSVPIFDTPVDASLPLASAAVDALGNSLAQAAYPYPGDAVAYGVPGAANTAVPVPANETSSYPRTPSSHLDAAAYSLHADSALLTSLATAQSSASNPAAGSAGTSSATAAVTLDPKSGLVTATATSLSSGLDLGAVVIGKVTSHVTVSRLPGGALTRKVGISIGESTVQGQTVAIGPKGITVAGSTTPVPSQVDTVTKALTAAGVEISYVRQIDTADGTVAPGVQVTQTTVDASSGSKAVTTWTFGQAAASASSGGTPDLSPSGTPVISAPVSSDPGTPPTVIPPSLTTDTSGAVTAPPVAVAPGAASVEAVAPVTAAPKQRLAVRLAAEQVGTSVFSFYLVLVAAGLVLVATSSSVRALGVRLLWTR